MVQIPSPQPFESSSSNRTGCFCVLPQSIVGFEPHRRRVPPQCRREPLCAATEAVKCKRAPAKPVLRGRQIPSPQPFKNSSSNRTGCFCVFWCGSGAWLHLHRGDKGGVPAPHHFPRLMKGCPLSFPVPVQKEEGLREEHGSARQIARGPLCGAAMAFPQKRPRSGGSRFVRRPRRSNAKGPPQNLFCGEGKSHPRNHVE